MFSKLFCLVFQTMIKFTEDAKADFLEDKPDLINFSKRSMVAEIIAEIQRYQHQPYCLDTYPELKVGHTKHPDIGQQWIFVKDPYFLGLKSIISHHISCFKIYFSI